MLLTLIRLFTLRQLVDKRLRTSLTTVGVSLGVALFVAISAINDSTLQFFRDNTRAMTGSAALTVLGDETGLAEELVAPVKDVAGVEAAVPMIETRATFQAASGARQTLVVLGIDFLQESAVRSYRSGSDALSDPLEFLNQADSIVVTATFARQNDLRIESPIALGTAHGKKSFVVRGIVSAEGAAAAYGGNVAIMDIDGARAMFSKEGKVDRIDVVPAEGVDPAALAKRIEAALPRGLRVELGQAQTETFARMVKGYQSVLSFLSTLALLVGVCLTFNTIALAVAERRREIAILRAIGATRSAMLELFVVEALILGAIGGLLGIGLGRLLAELMVDRVSASMTRQHVTPIDVSEIRFDVRHAALGVAAGTVAALVAALWPAWRATTVRCSEAVAAETSGATEASRHRGRALGVAGGLLLASLAVATRFDLGALSVVYPLVGGLGVMLVAPQLVALALRGLSALPLLSRTPMLRLAAENLALNGARTGRSVLGLVLGLMLVVVMATVHESFQQSVGAWQDRTFRGDVVVSSSGRVLSLDVQPLDDSLAAEIDRVPGVDVAEGRGARAMRVVRSSYQGRSIGLKAVDRPHPAMGFSFLDVVDRSSEEAGRALYSDSGRVVLVSTGFAAHFGKAAGDTIELPTPSGPASFSIGGVVVDFGHPEGVVYVSREAYKRHWNDSLVTAFIVQAAPGTSPAMVRSAIDAALGERGLVAALNLELRQQLDDTLRESLAYTRAIEAAALAVGLLGLLGTVVLSLVERMRELGMLRAIGVSRAQLVRMVLAEATLLGVIGGVVAAVLGALIAKLWVVGSLASSLGWSITVHVPWTAVSATLFAGLAVGLIAGLVSSRRVAFVPIREALFVTS